MQQPMILKGHEVCGVFIMVEFARGKVVFGMQWFYDVKEEDDAWVEKSKENEDADPLSEILSCEGMMSSPNYAISDVLSSLMKGINGYNKMYEVPYDEVYGCMNSNFDFPFFSIYDEMKIWGKSIKYNEEATMYIPNIEGIAQIPKGELGEDLDFAYESISAFSSRRSNQEAVLGTEESLKEIREATTAYRAEALELQKRLRRLQNQFDLLGGQASALIQGRRARVAATSSTNGQLLFVDEKLTSRNLEMNAVLEMIASSARELAHYHSGEEEGIYLSYADFHPYTMQDLACTKELNQWFVKQFDVGPSRLVAEEGKSKCSWVSLDDVTNCFIRGDSEKSYSHRVVELQRLRSIFGISERQWVEAQVEYTKQQAVLAKAKLQVSADEAHVHLDLQSLRRRNVEISGELNALSQEEEKLLYQVIPKICMDLADLQDTFILQGDYDLKVMRQEYYISQQKRFITHLVNQLARHQFLQIACQLERKTMNGAYELLRVINAELQSYVQATSGRVERCLSLIEAGSEPHEQGAVDDRDILLHRIRDLLSIHANNQGASPMYVSAPGIVQQIGSLQSDLMSLQSDLENSLAEDKSKCINE
ncbi:hypothetical protein KI387_014181, partial [Taxus chinensis]